MKKIRSQVSVALVCAILGFMLTYQFKVLMNRDKGLDVSKNATDITVEIEQYKKGKTALEKKLSDVEAQLKDYENNEANKNDTSKQIYSDLQISRTLLGLTDVQGEGVTIYLTPDTTLVNNNLGKITDRHLVYVLNELRFAGAEAISVNDIRITAKSGIRNSGNYIIVNGEDKISPLKRIVIKAIGDKSLLYSALSFPEVFADFNGICEVKFEKTDSLKIGKYNKVYKNKFAIPVGVK